MDQKKKERKRERLKVGNITMASYALQTPLQVAHTKPPGPTNKLHIFLLLVDLPPNKLV